jgi:Toxin SymE, type I toxin-antitoxin system
MKKPPKKIIVLEKRYKKRGKKYKTPSIKLSGAWIEQHGFPVGRECNVEVEFGKIVIT